MFVDCSLKSSAESRKQFGRSNDLYALRLSLQQLLNGESGDGRIRSRVDVVQVYGLSSELQIVLNPIF